jgi:hypothetical protein
MAHRLRPWMILIAVAVPAVAAGFVVVRTALAPPATPEAGPWDALRRPLQIPALTSGAPCPVSPAATVTAAFGPALGPGPVYPIYGADDLFAGEQTLFPAPWLGRKVLWIAAPTYTGPVLVRGRQLDGPNEVRFGSGPAPVAELQLETAAASGSAPPWRDWPGYTRVRAPGCYAYQVDGSSFSTVIVFQARVAPGP